MNSSQGKQPLTHLDEEGAARMVDIADKEITHREARAEATLWMKEETLRLLVNQKLPKGDVFQVARVAGILAAKKTWELIPLCHPIALSAIEIDFEIVDARTIRVKTFVKNSGKTGVEMEALTACSLASLTVYDMVKAVEPAMKIQNMQLVEKKGGKRGHWKPSSE